MIKLKDLILEYIPHEDKLAPFKDGDEVLKMLDSMIEYDRLVPEIADAISGYLTSDFDDFVNNMQKFVVGTFGSFDVILSDNYDDLTYILFDKSVDSNEDGYYEDAFVGVIQTRKADSWSKQIHHMLDIEGVSPEAVYGSKIVSSKMGKGIGSKFYDVVLKHAKVLLSDSELYDDSIRLWAHHMSKKTFFGMVLSRAGSEYSSYSTVLPLNAKTASDPRLFEFAARFVAVDDSLSIPTYLRKLKYNFSTVNFLEEMAVFQTTLGYNVKRIDISKSGDPYKNGDTLINAIEDELTSFEELFDLMQDGNEDRETGMMPNEAIHVPDSLESLKAVLIIMGDMEIVVKETNSGLSVTLL